VDYLPDIRRRVQAELGWDDARWEQEASDYLTRWQAHYGSPADQPRSDAALRKSIPHSGQLLTC